MNATVVVKDATINVVNDRHGKCKKPTNAVIKEQRAQFLLYPDLYGDIKKIANIQHTSVNEIVNKLLKEYRRNHLADLELYNKIH